MSQPQREWYEKDYYKILGVAEISTEKDITKAYRKLAKENHPDSHPGREERFKEISGAYSVLSDSEKRKSYDEVRKLGPMGNPYGPGTTRPGPGAGGGGFRTDDLGDLLGGLFNRGRGRGSQGGAGGANAGAPGPRRGDDLETSLSLSFADAVSGTTVSVNVLGDAPCETCNATGAAPGTSPVVCSQCGGRGVIDSNQGFFSFSQPCTACNGNGMRVDKPCPSCGGSGNARKARQVKVRVPAGVADAQRIRLKARGGAGRNGGAPGDLYVTVNVGGHDLFGRKGKDLTIKVPITFPEAALGATVTVPTLSDPVQLKVPAGTRSGRTFRVRGKGAPMTGGAGDLLITVEVIVPVTLTTDQRAAIEALAGASSTEAPRAHFGV